jgi:hypothetical protein
LLRTPQSEEIEPRCAPDRRTAALMVSAHQRALNARCP